MKSEIERTHVQLPALRLPRQKNLHVQHLLALQPWIVSQLVHRSRLVSEVHVIVIPFRGVRAGEAALRGSLQRVLDGHLL